MIRPGLLGSLTVISLAFLFAFTGSRNSQYAEDFTEFWTDVNDNYAYFDKKQTDWNQVKELYLPMAEKAQNRDELINIFEKASRELYDDHFNLNVNLKSSNRMVPSGLDFWAEFINEKAIVTEVRQGFSAYKAGIRPGMEILTINGIPVKDAVENITGKCLKKLDNEARNYYLRQLLAGNYITERVFEVLHKGKNLLLKPDITGGNLTDVNQYSLLGEFKILEGNIGYFRFNNSLGQEEIIRLFDSALVLMKNTSAMIIDLRETPGGGNTTVARGVLGRFITTELPYQKHVLPDEEKETGIRRSWIELVTPRGPFTYMRPLAVLAGHWTGSMGEGIVIGFDALNRATIIGTKMAGLNGSIEGFTCKNSGIPYSFPTEQLYHVNGTPREYYIPEVLIDLTNERYESIKDPVLQEALTHLKDFD